MLLIYDDEVVSCKTLKKNSQRILAESCAHWNVEAGL
jgi:hypothetical protein